MSPRALMLILVALAVTAGTVYYANSWLNRERAELEAMRGEPEKPEPDLLVLVASKPLAAGMFVRKDDLRWQPWPDKALPETYLVKARHDAATIVGGVVRRALEAGEPVTQGQVVAPGDRGFMAAVLNPGMRAVSLPVDAATAVAGFVFPGDRVDLILTMDFVEIVKLEDEKDTKEKRFGSETFLTGVRVLAIDQEAADRENEPSVGKTVTVEVTPEQVEMLAVAMRLGQISLALHSLARPDQASSEALAQGEEIQMATANETASDAAGAPQPNGLPQAMAGDAFETPAPGGSFTFDADASRLRRATLIVSDDDGPKVVQLRGETK